MPRPTFPCLAAALALVVAAPSPARSPAPSRLPARFPARAAALPSPAAPATPAFDPRDWHGAQAGPPTRVLTLGTAHLAGLAHPATPAMLAPLLDRLAAFHPTIITYEGVSGDQCEQFRTYPKRYPDAWDNYCWPLDDAAKATGLTLTEAGTQVDNLLANWPAQPTPAQRRHLAALFIAAGERPSALVQWLQLDPAERTTGDGIDPALLAILAKSSESRNETYAIAARLAARLGLARVYPVDDHTSDAIQAGVGADFEQFMRALWSRGRLPLVEQERQRAASLRTADDLLAYYRFINRPDVQRAFVAGDMGRAMRTPSAAGYGRAYLAWWETRNLRMVANVRAAFGQHPGARVLNLVGSSHKPYYDAYLAMMSDVELVSAEAALK